VPYGFGWTLSNTADILRLQRVSLKRRVYAHRKIRGPTAAELTGVAESSAPGHQASFLEHGLRVSELRLGSAGNKIGSCLRAQGPMTDQCAGERFHSGSSLGNSSPHLITVHRVSCASAPEGAAVASVPCRTFPLAWDYRPLIPLLPIVTADCVSRGIAAPDLIMLSAGAAGSMACVSVKQTSKQTY